MGFFRSSAPSNNFLAAPPAAPLRKKSQRFSRPRDDVDEFLSSDLELSFASTMSLHSPPRTPIDLTPDLEHFDRMDISPLPPAANPVFTRAPFKAESSSKPKNRPRAATTVSREFGRDMSNIATPTLQPPTISISKSGDSTSQPKRIQRSALPFEWLASVPSPRVDEDRATFLFAKPQEAISAQDMEDAMDVDTIVPGSMSRANPLLSSPPVSAAPTLTQFNNLFYDTTSPRRSSAESYDSPAGPLPKKRRSLSPESVHSPRRHGVVDESSPAPPSSPMAKKLERKSSGPLLSAFVCKPSLAGLGPPPANPNKRSRRPVFSAMVQPSDMDRAQSAYPVADGHVSQPRGLPPTRRAFSAMLIPGQVPDISGDESSMEGPDMSSPAQAYSKRQQVKTIRRCDGTDDFRPLTGATAMNKRDVLESPSAKFLAAGMPGFGDNEAHGKILPCHRVREDGLMRINPQTMDKLLDGSFDSQITEYHVIDCRFDYEYNGGHIPGAININTTSGVEEFLLGSTLNKPKQSVSGDPAKKTILVFHCEFSVKRAPTFAKHLRSKDRAMNNHVYPRIHYPEVYILEGGYCQYFKECAARCEPPAYVTMDDPNHALSRKEDLDQFRKAKFGRTKSYAYGEGAVKMNMMSQQQVKRITAPSGGGQLFAAADAARSRRKDHLTTLPEDANATLHSEDDDTDIGDSPCPPPTRNCAFKGKKLSRAPFARAETYGPARMAY
ncbi:hypothetical protein HWV62_17320 [Athelia sp. TMB]|nr:hypothetical protein HWV62_33575 [Athelia sp. TMB]KAF7972649.1 hypothetical protein HWV62_17320 [Athelia sp. TMB]